MVERCINWLWVVQQSVLEPLSVTASICTPAPICRWMGFRKCTPVHEGGNYGGPNCFVYKAVNMLFNPVKLAVLNTGLYVDSLAFWVGIRGNAVFGTYALASFSRPGGCCLPQTVLVINFTSSWSRFKHVTWNTVTLNYQRPVYSHLDIIFLDGCVQEVE